jgi:hypothetical protein
MLRVVFIVRDDLSIVAHRIDHDGPDQLGDEIPEALMPEYQRARDAVVQEWVDAHDLRLLLWEEEGALIYEAGKPVRLFSKGWDLAVSEDINGPDGFRRAAELAKNSERAVLRAHPARRTLH